MTNPLPIGTRVRVARHWFLAGAVGAVSEPGPRMFAAGPGWTCIDLDGRGMEWVQTAYIEPIAESVEVEL